MILLVVIGAVLSLAAIVVNVMAIIMGFKESVFRGVIALLAPLLLGAGLWSLGVVAHSAAVAEIGAKEVQDKGEGEAEAQIEELKNAENIDLGL